MSSVRRFRSGLKTMAGITAIVLVLGAGTAGANTAPTVPTPVPEGIVSTQAMDDRGQAADINAAHGRGPSDPQVLDTILAQTGSSTGLLVISGVILLVIGASLLGGRRVYDA